MQVANESHKQSANAFDISIASFSVEVISTERTDHTWVALAYGMLTYLMYDSYRRASCELLVFCKGMVDYCAIYK